MEPVIAGAAAIGIGDRHGCLEMSRLTVTRRLSMLMHRRHVDACHSHEDDSSAIHPRHIAGIGIGCPA